MERQRVDIKLSKEVLKWAAIEAATIGISRREYISKCVEACFERKNINGNITPEMLIKKYV